MNIDLEYASKLTQRVVSIDGIAHLQTMLDADVVDDVALGVNALHVPIEIDDVMQEARLRACRTEQGVSTIYGSVDLVTGGIENVTVGGMALGKLKVHMPPPQFSMPAALSALKAYQVNGVFYSSIQPEDLIDTTTWTQVYFVDNVGGSDANTGRSWALRKKSIGSAMRAASASGLPSRILVWDSGVPYYRAVGVADDAIARASAVNVLLESMNGRIVTGPFDNLTWALNSGATYTYKATLAISAFRAINPSLKDNYGLPVEYTWAESAAACESTDGSWYTNGTYVYVHPHGGDVPTLKNCMVLLNAINLQWDCNKNLFVRGFDFIGGNQGALYCSTGTTNTVVVDDCSFRYSAKSNTYNGGTTTVTGCKVNGVGLFAAFGSDASRNSLDGFGAIVSASTPFPFLVGCTAYANGLSPAQSNNGFTTHGGIKSVTIGCKWLGNYGTNSGHIDDNTQVWSVGDVAGSSMGDAATGGVIAYSGFGTWSGAAKMWLDSCRDVGAEYGVYASTGSEIYMRNHRGTGRIAGAGVHTTY